MECCRDGDSSKKKVYPCELCERCFCEKHLEPKLVFIKDLEAIENVPEIRVLYYTEIRGKEGKGHPDFEYSRRRFRELDIEERRQNELIKQALDRMNQYFAEIEEKPIDLEEARKRTVELLLKEDEERERIFKEAEERAKEDEEKANLRNLVERAQEEGHTKEITIIDEGDFHYDVVKVRVPDEVLVDKNYRKKITQAKTRREVETIMLEFYKNKVKK